MNNLNITQEIGSSNSRIEALQANNKAKDVEHKDISAEQQVQKVAEESAISTEIKQPELEDVVKEINNVMASVQRDINFSIDEKSGRKVISVYEKGTDKLIRQLPSEEALKLLDNLEQLKGILFKADV